MSLESSGNSLPYAAEPFCRPRTAILDLGSLIGIYPQSHRQFDPYSNNLVGEPITKEIQIDYSIIPLCDQSTAAGLHCITEMGIIPPSDLKHAIDLAVEHSGERPWGMLNPISPITSTLVSMIGLKPEGLVTYAGIYTSLLVHNYANIGNNIKPKLIDREPKSTYLTLPALDQVATFAEDPVGAFEAIASAVELRTLLLEIATNRYATTVGINKPYNFLGREPYGKSLTRALSALCRHFFTDPEQVSGIQQRGGAEINAGFNLLMTARPGSMPNVNPANLLADIAPDDGKGIIIHTQQGEIYARNTRKPILAPHHDFPEWSARIFRVGTCPLFTHIMQAQNP